MVLLRKNKKWMPLHISLDLKQLNELETMVEKSVKEKLDETHLNRQWKAIDIVDIQILSSNYNPNKNTTFVEVLVFVADITGEQLD